MVDIYLSNSEKVYAELSWKAEVDLSEGLRRTLMELNG